MKDEKLYLIHIIESIDIINRYTEGSVQRFITQDIVRDAVLRKLQLMTESTQKLSKESKAAYPHIAWRDISDFRNVLVHDYLGDINYDLIWTIIEEHLPILREAARKLLEEKTLKDKE